MPYPGAGGGGTTITSAAAIVAAATATAASDGCGGGGRILCDWVSGMRAAGAAPASIVVASAASAAAGCGGRANAGAVGGSHLYRRRLPVAVTGADASSGGCGRRHPFCHLGSRGSAVAGRRCRGGRQRPPRHRRQMRVSYGVALPARLRLPHGPEAEAVCVASRRLRDLPRRKDGRADGF